MIEKELSHEIDKLNDYLCDLMENNSASAFDVLRIMEYVVGNFIFQICAVMKWETDGEIESFFKSIRSLVAMMKLSKEVGYGNNIEEAVDKYIHLEDSELRREFINFVRQKSGDDLLQSIIEEG